MSKRAPDPHGINALLRRTRAEALDNVTAMLLRGSRGFLLNIHFPAINVRTDDFHALRSEQVQVLLDVAKEWGYREPKHANGSRARCFFYMLQRHANRSAKP
jgi:hypothetical protein